MIKLIECPRDAMQGLSYLVKTEDKVKYINQLLHVGFDTIDFGSFVNPKAVPQMADTREVLEELCLEGSPTHLLAIVANLYGFEQACLHKEIKYLGYPLSISETFQKRNTNKTIAASYELVQEMLKQRDGERIVFYLSMGFGNPYGDPWTIKILLKHVERLVGMGGKIISLADTTGLANLADIAYIFREIIRLFPETEFGAHFHSHPSIWHEKVQTAFEHGCTRFDTALLGFGGCPFAEDELVGNIPTEKMVSFLKEKGYNVICEEKFLQVLETSKQIFYGN